MGLDSGFELDGLRQSVNDAALALGAEVGDERRAEPRQEDVQRAGGPTLRPTHQMNQLFRIRPDFLSVSHGGSRVRSA